MAKVQFLEAGQIVGTHGVRGEVRIQPWCDTPSQIAAMKTLYWDEAGTRPVKIKARVHKNIALAVLDGVTTVEEAMTLKGKMLYAHRDDFRLPKDRYFVRDLLGLAVIDHESGERYGEVVDVSQTGANSVYHVKTPKGEVLIPAVPLIINEVDVDGGVIRITPIGGLFDDED